MLDRSSIVKRKIQASRKKLLDGRAALRIMKASETVILKPRQRGQDLRDYPLYTLPEAALVLGVPRRTMQYWLADTPLWTVARGDSTYPLLSFRDLAQAHAVDIIRRHYGLSLAAIRAAFAEAKKESKSHYPLLSKHIKLFLKHIILTRPARGRQPRRDIDLTRGRQMAIPPIIDLYATRIRRDRRTGEPAQIFPWRLWKTGDDRKPVSVDPNIMSGKLVITGTRIPVLVVLKRAKSGEQIAEIAQDYRLHQQLISQALTHIDIHSKAA